MKKQKMTGIELLLCVAVGMILVLLDVNNILPVKSFLKTFDNIKYILAGCICLVFGMIVAVLMIKQAVKNHKNKINDIEQRKNDALDYHNIGGLFYRIEKQNTAYSGIFAYLLSVGFTVTGLLMLLHSLARFSMTELTFQFYVAFPLSFLLIAGLFLFFLGYTGNKITDRHMLKLSDLEKITAKCIFVSESKKKNRKKPYYTAVYLYSTGVCYVVHKEEIKYTAKNKPKQQSKKDIYYSREQKRAITRNEFIRNNKMIFGGLAITILTLLITVILFFV